jgi:hypothetical protein
MALIWFPKFFLFFLMEILKFQFTILQRNLELQLQLVQHTSVLEFISR